LTDHDLRRLERLVAQGDTRAEIDLFHARVRAGHLTRYRIELAAYCSHEPALELEDEQWWRDRFNGLPRLMSFEDWIGGLAAWGRGIQVRAWAAAALEAVPVWEANPARALEDAGPRWFRDRLTNPRQVLNAILVWLEDPTGPNLDQWSQAWHAGVNVRPPSGHSLFCLGPRETGAEITSTTLAATRLVHGGTIRDTIQVSLIGWAIRGL